MSDLLRRNFPDYAASKEIVPVADGDNDYPLMVREDRILRLPRDVLLRPGETDRITLNGTEIPLGGSASIGTKIVGSNTELASLSTSDYQSVIRFGHTEYGDSPPLAYRAGVGPSALNGGLGDGFSEIPSADGNHWFASFSDGKIDVLQVPGIDPTGASSCDAAFNAAAAVIRNGKRLNIVVPPGDYLVTDAIQLANGQGLCGVGSTLANLRINDQFNPAALGVVVITGAEQNAPFVRDINFDFEQPSDQTSRANFKTLADGGTSSLGGTGVKYPPAVYGSGNARVRIERVRVSGAWDGFNLAGNSGGMWINDIEMGAVNRGLIIDGALDFCHIHRWHQWPFGFRSAELLSVWKDLSTIGWQLGTLSGLSAHDVKFFSSKVNITAAFGNITDIGLDIDGSGLYVSGGAFLNVTGLYSSRGDVDPTASVEVSGSSRVVLQNASFFISHMPAIKVSGGWLTADGGQVIRSGLITNAVLFDQTADSHMAIMNYKIGAGVFNDGVTPVFRSTAAGSATSMVLIGNHFPSVANVGAGPVVSLAADTAANFIAGNNFNGRSFVPPGGIGEYGPNNTPQLTAIPSVSFATPGTFNPTYTNRFTVYKFIGSGLIWYRTEVNIADAGSYAGAAGSLEIDTGIPILPVGGGSADIERMSKVTFPAGEMLFAQLQPTGKVFIRRVGSGVDEALLSPTAIPSGATQVIITVSGTYRTRAP